MGGHHQRKTLRKYLLNLKEVLERSSSTILREITNNDDNIGKTNILKPALPKGYQIRYVD